MTNGSGLLGGRTELVLKYPQGGSPCVRPALVGSGVKWHGCWDFGTFGVSSSACILRRRFDGLAKNVRNVCQGQPRYSPGMATSQKTTDDPDFISQFVDKGEDTLRQMVDRPRRMVDGAIQGLADRVHDLAVRLRAIDPLERRVAEIETRLDALEEPTAAAARRQSRPAKPSTSRTAPTAVATEPGPVEHDRGHRSVAGAEGELERADARARDERESAG